MCYILCGLIVLVIEARVLNPVWVDRLGDRSSCAVSCVG